MTVSKVDVNLCLLTSTQKLWFCSILCESADAGSGVTDRVLVDGIIDAALTVIGACYKDVKVRLILIDYRLYKLIRNYTVNVIMQYNIKAKLI